MTGRESLLLLRIRWWLRLAPKPFSKLTYMEHAAIGEAFSARMFSENPGLSADAVTAYRWAESQFNRIARGEVGERDLIG